MPEFISRLVSQFKEFWNGLDGVQKKRIYITTAILSFAIAVSLIFIAKPSYTILISGADKKEVGEMTSILEENKIWYKIDNAGSDILIKASDNDRAQVILAQEGYPKGGMTFEDAIGMIGISTTESDKKQIWRKQQTSDLERKLRMLDNIEDASVSLALPEKSIFLTSNGEKSKPTAWVRVKPTEELTSAQVKGIVMLVSRSVENLDPADVTVVDNNLNILNDQYEDEYIEAISTQEEMRFKKAYELEQRVMKYFSVGQYDNFDTLRVVANPYLDFNKSKSTSRTLLNPDGMDSGAIISSQERSEKLENGTMGGLPGTDSNPGETPLYQVGGDGKSSYQSGEKSINYDYDEMMTEEEKAIGTLVAERSTMAISLWYGQRVTDEDKLSDDFLEQVKNAASTATGIPVRNISVYKYKIAPQEEAKIPTSHKIRELIEQYGFFVMLLVLVIGLLIAVAPRKAEKAEFLQKVAVAEGPQAEEKKIEELKYEDGSELKRQIDNFVRQKPEAVAQLLRNWLTDDWD
jgi:flagellar M-ring protein FliF